MFDIQRLVTTFCQSNDTDPDTRHDIRLKVVEAQWNQFGTDGDQGFGRLIAGDEHGIIEIEVFDDHLGKIKEGQTINFYNIDFYQKGRSLILDS